jgi:hypothetical protein
MMSTSLAVLAFIFDRLGHHEPAASISGVAATPYARTAVPEITTAIAHLREVLGDQAYESLAGKGETMTTAEMELRESRVQRESGAACSQPPSTV